MHKRGGMNVDTRRGDTIYMSRNRKKPQDQTEQGKKRGESPPSSGVDIWKSGNEQKDTRTGTEYRHGKQWNHKGKTLER